MFEWVIAFVLPLIFSLILFPVVSKFMKQKRIVGKDQNKKSKPEVPEMGGVIIALSIILTLLILIGLTQRIELLYVVFALITITIFGCIDDLYRIPQKIKAIALISPLLFVLPIIPNTTLLIPVIGLIELGFLYYVIAVLGVTGSANGFNMLAGLNGLEAGMGLIISITIGVMLLLSNQLFPLIITISLIGALLGFLKYNWYPSKIFPGDSGTLLIGGAIGIITILGKIEFFGVMLFSVYLVELIIKSKNKFKGQCFGLPSGKYLNSPRMKESLTHYVMGTNRFTEVQVTQVILGLQTAVSVIVLTLFVVVA